MDEFWYWNSTFSVCCFRRSWQPIFDGEIGTAIFGIEKRMVCEQWATSSVWKTWNLTFGSSIIVLSICRHRHLKIQQSLTQLVDKFVNMNTSDPFGFVGRSGRSRSSGPFRWSGSVLRWVVVGVDGVEGCPSCFKHSHRQCDSNFATWPLIRFKMVDCWKILSSMTCSFSEITSKESRVNWSSWLWFCKRLQMLIW